MIPHGGVLFAAIMFIILSMMVIWQSDKLRFRLDYKPAAVEAVNLLNECRGEAMNKDRAVKEAVDALATCQQENKKEGSLWESILASRGLDEPLLAYILGQSQPAGLLPEEKMDVLVRRASPSGEKTAVVYGFKAPSQYPLGFFVRDNAFILSTGIYVSPNFGEGGESIKNVRWKDEKTITYDHLITGQGGTETRHETFSLDTP